MPSSIVLIRPHGQPIEILPSPTTDPIRIAASPATEDLKEKTTADLVYFIELPDGTEVRPADWRHMAYDHDAIHRLVAGYAIQNATTIAFQPLTKATLAQLQASLLIALKDLSSVLDVTDVRCTAGETDMIAIEITGEHKNGEVATVQVRVPIS